MQIQRSYSPEYKTHNITIEPGDMIVTPTHVLQITFDPNSGRYGVVSMADGLAPRGCESIDQLLQLIRHDYPGPLELVRRQGAVMEVGGLSLSMHANITGAIV